MCQLIFKKMTDIFESAITEFNDEGEGSNNLLHRYHVKEGRYSNFLSFLNVSGQIRFQAKLVLPKICC